MKKFLSLLVLTLFVTACGSLPDRPRSRVNPALIDAQSLYQQGRFVESALAFTRLANTTDPDRHWLRAADAYWMASDLFGTQQSLRQVDSDQLSGDDAALARLLRIASADAPPAAGRVLLDLSFAAEQVQENYRVLFHHLRAQALLERRQAYQSALERVAMDPYLTADQRLDNQQRILGLLQILTIEQADTLASRHQSDDEMFGWLRLIAFTKQATSDGLSIADAVSQWKRLFPRHPGAREELEQLLTGLGPALGQPSNIALLLPMTGRFAQAGRSVRDGFLAAFYADPERSAKVRVYDVGDSPERAALQYDLAMRDGAEQIIGPLSKEAVTEMLLMADGSVPVLALNESRDDVPAAPGVFQFGLLPEQEAASVARRMIADGKLRAIVLVPTSNWGDRVADAFARSYQINGGEVLSISRYPSIGTDYGPIIKGALGLSASTSRVRQLEQTIGLRLEAEASTRSDLDAIFLAAQPRQGRLMKPQFEFHNAEEVPVYATSAIYAGQPQPNMDKDMNGLRFCDQPWVIGAPGEAPSADLTRRYLAPSGTPLRLFGLGLDAYRVLPYLSWLTQSPTDSFPGASGELSITGDGKFQRELSCAEFRRGLARYLEPPALIDESAGDFGG